MVEITGPCNWKWLAQIQAKSIKRNTQGKTPPVSIDSADSPQFPRKFTEILRKCFDSSTSQAEFHGIFHLAYALCEDLNNNNHFLLPISIKHSLEFLLLCLINHAWWLDWLYSSNVASLYEETLNGFSREEKKDSLGVCRIFIGLARLTSTLFEYSLD